MAVVQIHPNLREGDFTKGFNVKRNSVFYTGITSGENTRCEFRSSQDVELWPISISDARLTATPPDLPNLEKYHIAHHRLKGALRIKLTLPEDTVFSQLSGLDRLPFYISGDERIVSHIFEHIHAHQIAVIARTSTGAVKEDVFLGKEALGFDGLKTEQSLLPVDWNIFHGHILLQEYFACRQRFYFFSLNQLSKALKDSNAQEIEFIILMDKHSPQLAEHISASCFKLFCTPVINLFPRRMDKIEVTPNLNEFHVIPDLSRPNDFEVFSISSVLGHQVGKDIQTEFRPMYQTRHSDKGNFGRYFSTNRKIREKQQNDNRKYTTRASYEGTEMYISLVDQNDAPFHEDIRYLSVDAMVTNRDLPRLLTETLNMPLSTTDTAPVHGAQFVISPSSPQSPYIEGEYTWRLIRQLSFNYIPLSDMPHTEGGKSLRDMLTLFIPQEDSESKAQIEALVGCHTEPVIRRLPGNGFLHYGRGVRCTLTVDEDGFSGLSPYLFGLIMENYLSRHAAVNVFTETELRSMQRGHIGLWKARPGRRGVL
jgi:type VI secretion system protein ImpG